MSTTTSTLLPLGPPAEPLSRPTVEQYHTMIDAGVLGDDDPVELLEGWLVIKIPKHSPHSLSNELVAETLRPLLRKGWHLRSQQPITTDSSEPEPDNAVVRGMLRDFTFGHPTPKDTPLLIEVSDFTLTRDRGIKKRIYARAGIPVYWIVNLIDRCVEVYTEPSGPAEQPDYRKQQVLGPDDSVSVVLDGQEVGKIQVKQLLP